MDMKINTPSHSKKESTLSREEKSAAYRRNLKETRKFLPQINENTSELLGYSTSRKGINQRCKELLEEYHHKFTNPQLVTEMLVKVAIGDLWFYNGLKDRETAFHLILSIFADLLQKDYNRSTLDRLMQTLISFTGKLAEENDVSIETIKLCFEIMENIYDIDPVMIVRNSTYLKNHLTEVYKIEETQKMCFTLCRNVLQKAQLFWQYSSHLEEWYQSKQTLFNEDYSELIKISGDIWLKSQQQQLDQVSNWDELCKLQFYSEIAQHFRSLINSFHSHQEKIYYILYLLHLEDMYQMRKNLLMDLNRSMRLLGKEVKSPAMRTFMIEIFKLFNELKDKYRETVLDSILALGKTVLKIKNLRLIQLFNSQVIKMGFVSFKEFELDREWQVIVDPNHIKNIRVWMELIELDPINMKPLLAALIVNLRVGNIFISDTDLFQKDISRFLQCDIKPIYKQVKQLARIFPIYFNKVGAEGELREITTAIDEIGRRQDKLLHFLRKQAHTESNNTNINLAEMVLHYWFTGEKPLNSKQIPQDILQELDTSHEFFIHNHELLVRLGKEYDCDEMGLTTILPRKLEKSISQHQDIPEIYQKKVFYLIRIYNILVEKYSFGITDLNKTLTSSGFFKQSQIDKLIQHINGKKHTEALEELFSMMQILTDVIFSPDETTAKEDIYYKRHVAAGIPSMYGQYEEPRFDALGLIFRLEQLAKHLLDELEKDIQFNYMTHSTVKKIYNMLKLFDQGLKIDGISNPGFTSNLEMYRYSLNSSFGPYQYLNMFQFIAESTKGIVKEYFYRIFETPLNNILPQYISHDSTKTKQQQISLLTEKFYRDLLSSAFIIQKLDNFIMKTLKSLRDILNIYKTQELRELLLSYELNQIISPLYKATPALDNPIFLGSKAYFLKIMHANNFPIPPGFVLSTELFRHRKLVRVKGLLRKDLLTLIKHNLNILGKISGKIYGDKTNPLLLSVRSGTAMSMPGAMNTFLNVGMNDDIALALSKQPNMAWSAWDCYRRFLQSWGMAEGIDRDEFDKIIDNYKDKFKIDKKLNFSSQQMKEIAFTYKKKLIDSGKPLIEEPFEQLVQAISYVLDSWDSARAMVYRERMQISHKWGTAVIVQQMVMGNMSNVSGTGVLFTHDPNSKQSGVRLYGEYTVGSQGEDIVAGLVNIQSLTRRQAKKAKTDPDMSLESRLPKIYNKLNQLAKTMVYKQGFAHQEIEFTFESDNPEDLYILQTRSQDISNEKDFQIFKTSRDKMDFVGSGIGIGGGALNGILAFDDVDLDTYREKYPQQALILVRPDTVPDDIGMIFKCDGLITGRGGATSHAAVTAVRLGIVCIVNCQQLQVNEKEKFCRIDDIILKSGDKVAIDGHFGNIFIGNYPVHKEHSDYQG